MLNNKYYKALLLILLATSAFYVFLTYREKTSSQQMISIKDYVLQSFVAELDNINKNLPHRLDGDTTLLSINYINGKVVSKYMITTVVFSSEFKNKFDANIIPSIKSKTCSEELKGRLIGAGIDLLEQYQDSQGRIISEILLNQESCNKN